MVIPNYPHHVTQRGNRRQKTLFRENDYRNITSLIKQHTRTGRPPGGTEFIRKLEVFTGEELAPKRPGRKPINGNRYTVPRILHLMFFGGSSKFAKC